MRWFGWALFTGSSATCSTGCTWFAATWLCIPPTVGDCCVNPASCRSMRWCLGCLGWALLVAPLRRAPLAANGLPQHGLALHQQLANVAPLQRAAAAARCRAAQPPAPPPPAAPPRADRAPPPPLPIPPKPCRCRRCRAAPEGRRPPKLAPQKHSTTPTRGRAAVARAPWLLSETWGRLDRRGPASPRGALWAAARLTINNDGTD